LLHHLLAQGELIGVRPSGRGRPELKLGQHPLDFLVVLPQDIERARHDPLLPTRPQPGRLRLVGQPASCLSPPPPSGRAGERQLPAGDGVKPLEPASAGAAAVRFEPGQAGGGVAGAWPAGDGAGSALAVPRSSIRFRCGTTVYFGSLAEASPAWKMPQRVVTEAAISAAPDSAAIIRRGRPSIGAIPVTAAPVAPSAASALPAFM